MCGRRSLRLEWWLNKGQLRGTLLRATLISEAQIYAEAMDEENIDTIEVLSTKITWTNHRIMYNSLRHNNVDPGLLLILSSSVPSGPQYLTAVSNTAPLGEIERSKHSMRFGPYPSCEISFPPS